ncbi:AbrB/MazE/SpoVT family DNA-binding domain-containing protein [Streptomyces microflavus]|uniref:AbrB/MazE/SpoVT family DNA-binding domain-containing protein n=1 Tax=Streptomyces microflavus TaxID=1919 RepID=UPI0033A56948
MADAEGSWRIHPVIREPAEVSVESDGRVELPSGLLAEAGINVGEDLLAFSDGDGRIVLRRASDAINDLLRQGTL